MSDSFEIFRLICFLFIARHIFAQSHKEFLLWFVRLILFSFGNWSQSFGSVFWLCVKHYSCNAAWEHLTFDVYSLAPQGRAHFILIHRVCRPYTPDWLLPNVVSRDDDHVRFSLGIPSLSLFSVSLISVSYRRWVSSKKAKRYWTHTEMHRNLSFTSIIRIFTITLLIAFFFPLEPKKKQSADSCQAFREWWHELLPWY